MAARKPKLVFFGNEKLATGDWQPPGTILRSVLSAGHTVSALVTYPEGPRDRPDALRVVAQERGIPVLRPRKLDDSFMEELDALDPDVGILAAYGKIIPQSVLDRFPCGILNIHPSLLPQYRGPTPVEQAILDGVSETGVSLMRLVRAMDAGPLYDQRTLSLHGTESKRELAETLSVMGAEMLTTRLPQILDGRATLTEQDDDLASYTPLIEKSSGDIDWQLPAQDIERQIRAYLGWPGSRTRLADRDVTVLSARIVSETGPSGRAFVTSGNELGVHCGENALVIDSLKPAGKQTMSGPAFLAGYKHKL